MPDTLGDPNQRDLSDIPYEIRTWLLEYELLSREIIRLKDELSHIFPVVG